MWAERFVTRIREEVPIYANDLAAPKEVKLRARRVFKFALPVATPRRIWEIRDAIED